MPLAISIDNMVSEVARELNFRGRVYPRWVTQGKIRPEKAADQIERMKAVLEALEELRLARAFFAAATPAGADLTFDNAGIQQAWRAWCAPRYAPLTQGTQIGAMPGDKP